MYAIEISRIPFRIRMPEIRIITNQNVDTLVNYIAGSFVNYTSYVNPPTACTDISFDESCIIENKTLYRTILMRRFFILRISDDCCHLFLFSSKQII